MTAVLRSGIGASSLCCIRHFQPHSSVKHPTSLLCGAHSQMQAALAGVKGLSIHDGVVTDLLLEPQGDREAVCGVLLGSGGATGL